MSVSIFHGDLLKSNCQYICHQVNYKGVMGSGIAKTIKQKYPEVYKMYKEAFESYKPEELYTHIQDCIAEDDRHIINMYSQFDYGTDKRYTSYDAFWNCLNEIKEWIPQGSKIGFPYKIACDRGGANWEVIKTMIEEVLSKDFIVEIWRLN